MHPLHRELCAALAYDARSHGSCGRASTRAFDTVGLLPGDKLEPNAELRDISAFDRITDSPCELLWWRPSSETLTKHRNPLLSEALGITVGAIAIAALHALHIGVLKRIVMRYIWKLFERDVYGVVSAGSHIREAALALNCSAFATSSGAGTTNTTTRTHKIT